MDADTLNARQLGEALVALQSEVQRLTKRLESLERESTEREKRASSAAAAPPVSTAAAPSTPPPKKSTEPLSEELVTVISAAIAAFLGVKPRIRQIRLVSGSSWSQQGRVTIQASHNLPIQHS